MPLVSVLILQIEIEEKGEFSVPTSLRSLGSTRRVPN